MKPILTLATCHTPEGVLLALIKHDRDYFLMLGGGQLMSTEACSSEQTMAELACANMPAKPRVLIGGFGFGFTLKRVLELSPSGCSTTIILPHWRRSKFPTWGEGGWRPGWWSGGR